MGDIAFNVSTFVLNKTVDLDMTKDIDVNVNISDRLAAAEAEAEAFGSPALAEVDAYTLVTSPTSVCEPLECTIDAIGTLTYKLGDDNNGDGAADSITINFTTVDDINASNCLEPWSSPPPDTPDGVIPAFDPETGKLYFSMIDMVLNQIGTVFQVDNILEAEYELESDLVINFSNRTADLNCDGVANAGDLKLTILAGSLFVAEYLDGASAREGPIAVETDDLLASAYFTHTGEPNLFDDVGVLGAYEVTKFNMNLSLESAAGKWFFEATGRFFKLVNDGGTAFAYAESTAAVDLTPDDVSKKKGN